MLRKKSAHYFFFWPLVIALAVAFVLPASGVHAQDAGESVPLEVASADSATSTTSEKVNQFFNSALGSVNGVIANVLFFSVTGDALRSEKWDKKTETPIVNEETGETETEVLRFPFIVALLIFGGIFFTIILKFINLRGLKHSVDVVRGRFDDPADEGEVSHFRALTSALSATVGLGNIAGVAVAIQTGGPGAVFWMTMAGFFGMAAKFSECTLGQMYRNTNPDGTISGGPMYYLERGMKTYGTAFGFIGKALAILFAVMVMGGAFGGGNMFQSNQACEAIITAFGWEGTPAMKIGFGLLMAVSVAIVIIGGIKRIGAATSKIVPAMAAIYVIAALAVLFANFTQIPSAFASIIRQAFTDNAMFGGLIGVLIIGVTRASFSSEAGLGSASIAHSAAKTDEPVREGMVALLEPFIDTIIICNMTALVIVITGVYHDIDQTAGVALTQNAFRTVLPWFPMILAFCILLFAYSTMISWAYYGERGWIYLLDHFGEGTGLRTLIIFRIVFIFFTFVGAITSLQAVVDFSDMMILSMAFPNIIGLLILTPILLKAVNDYWRRFKSGEMQPDR